MVIIFSCFRNSHGDKQTNRNWHMEMEVTVPRRMIESKHLSQVPSSFYFNVLTFLPSAFASTTRSSVSCALCDAFQTASPAPFIQPLQGSQSCEDQMRRCTINHGAFHQTRVHRHMSWLTLTLSTLKTHLQLEYLKLLVQSDRLNWQVCLSLLSIKKPREIHQKT